MVLAIIIIRTGATNIADWLAFCRRVPPVALELGLVLLLAAFAWSTSRIAPAALEAECGLPGTGAAYWAAMLTAGVLGTVLGDDARSPWVKDRRRSCSASCLRRDCSPRAVPRGRSPPTGAPSRLR